MSESNKIRFVFKDAGSISVEFTLQEFLDTMSEGRPLTKWETITYTKLFQKILKRKNHKYLMNQTVGEDEVLHYKSKHAQMYMEDIVYVVKQVFEN